MLHFSENEFEQRLAKLREKMVEENLDAMLLFAQESMYWLTGYDTFGFCFFQTVLVTHNEPVALLTRSADLRQAQLTSNIKNIDIWVDGQDVDPTKNVSDMLKKNNLVNKRVGVETNTHGLTFYNGQLLHARIGSMIQWVEASFIISNLRLIKSDAEIEYVKKAASIGDGAYAKALLAIEEGKDESNVIAALQGEIFAQGGDFPANEIIAGVGANAILCRYQSGRSIIQKNDQFTLEWAGVYKHYHAALMRTVVVGKPTEKHLYLQKHGAEALLACEEVLKPDRPMGDVFAKHAQVLDAAGLSKCRLKACGYSLGARFSPSWMEHQMFYENAETIMQKNMVFFLHMILADSESGAANCIGRTSIITDAGSQTLSELSLELTVV